MKIRNDFVTNSSSSSFIIQYKKNTSFNITFNDLSDDDKFDYYESEIDGLWERIINSSHCQKMLDQEGIIKMLKEEYIWETNPDDLLVLMDDDLSEKFKHYSSLLSDNNLLYFPRIDDGSFTYDDLDLLSRIIVNNNDLKDNILVDEIYH